MNIIDRQGNLNLLSGCLGRRLKSVSGNRFGRISLIIAIAAVLYTPGQTDLSRTGIQSILVKQLREDQLHKRAL